MKLNPYFSHLTSSFSTPPHTSSKRKKKKKKLESPKSKAGPRKLPQKKKKSSPLLLGLTVGSRIGTVRDGMDGSIMCIQHEHTACLCSTWTPYKAVRTKLIGDMRTDAPPTNGRRIPGQRLMPKVLGLFDLLAYHSGH